MELRFVNVQDWVNRLDMIIPPCSTQPPQSSFLCAGVEGRALEAEAERHGGLCGAAD